MSLAGDFAATGADELRVDGRAVRQVWRLDADRGRLHVTRLSVGAPRPQGLVVDADVDLSVGDHEGRRIVLWSHTAPALVEIEVPGPTEIRLWNVWSDDGLTQAWLGDAGLHVRSAGATIRLACRAGDEHGDFDSLVVDVRYERR